MRKLAALLAATLMLLSMVSSGVLTGCSKQAAPLLPSITDPLYTRPIADPAAIPKFVNPLPIPSRVDVQAGGTLDMYMGETSQDLGLLGPNAAKPVMTKVWGYGTQPNGVSYPGPTIVAASNVPVNVNWQNDLGFSHPLPIDPTFSYALSDAPYKGHTISELGVPAVPHLHGGHVESESDGLPEAWWTPLYHTDTANPLSRGADFVKNVYAYDNSQEAATLWYHDHTMGITRLNVYMGLAGFYLLRDATENALTATHQIPGGANEIELVVQDRMFYPDGQLAYPDTAADSPSWPGGPSAQPEFFGDVILVNGKAWPVMDVQPQKYRFRMLNGSDSRFYNLKMAAGADAALGFTQIGSDDGLLPAPLQREELLMGPGERCDVVVDFSDPALLGQTIIVTNDAASPFPDGNQVNPDTAGQIMAFRVGSTPVTDPALLPAALRAPLVPLKQKGATRQLQLFESMDGYGRIRPSLGTVIGGYSSYMFPVTENPGLNDVEVWEIYNTTVDAHPIHLHLVSFQVLGSQEFSGTQDPVTGALFKIVLSGASEPPAPENAGGKDTVIVYPGRVTRLIAHFDKPGMYVWHCHILSHEDHEMMRPYFVGPMPK